MTDLFCFLKLLELTKNHVLYRSTVELVTTFKIFNEQVLRNAVYNHYIVKNSLLIKLTGGPGPPGPSDAPPMIAQC